MCQIDFLTSANLCFYLCPGKHLSKIFRYPYIVVRLCTLPIIPDKLHQFHSQFICTSAIFFKTFYKIPVKRHGIQHIFRHNISAFATADDIERIFYKLLYFLGTIFKIHVKLLLFLYSSTASTLSG